MPFLKWCKIGQVSGVVKNLNDRRQYMAQAGLEVPSSSVFFRLKPKMHGTNAGIGLTAKGEVIAQSRNRIVTPDNDNAGFARWVKANEDYFKTTLRPGGVLFGEWSAAGMKGAAFGQIKQKVFTPFGWVPYDAEQRPDDRLVVVDPVDLAGIAGDHEDIFVIPWVGPLYEVTYTDPVSRGRFQEALGSAVLEWEKQDQWVLDTFGVDGVGEGFVGYPYDTTGRGGDFARALTYKQLDTQLFKAKGEKHSKSKVTKVAAVDVEKVKTQAEFAQMFVTPQRCEQGVQEACGGDVDVKLTGKFIGWMAKDVHDESKNEVEASGYTWKDLSPGVVQAARTWYLDEVAKF